ncbi:hypothetical protein MKW92_043303 [Papaver armeniacum]|nr:hypothetical protein MKW92_043303 [Papaver armeniacum]
MKSFVSKPIFLVYAYLLIVVLVSNSRPASSWLEVENQEDFSYVTGSGNGPENWGNLRPEWATCKNGTQQSPINLAFSKMQYAPELGDLQMKYTPASGILKNRGHDISLQWAVAGAAGSIQIDDITYVLDQIHWHSPSEHTVNGRRFALELHMVHKNVELKKVAVVAVLYCLSIFKDPFLSKVIDRKYYRYLGSLTTPPCDEGVTWTIKRKVMPVRIDQVMLLRSAVHDGNGNNARPLQPLNNREILYYSALPTSVLVDSM